MINFNINNNIRFKLTEHGERKLKSYIESIDLIDGDTEYLKQALYDRNQADQDGYHTMHMWYAMSLFGDCLYNGAENIFEGNVIHIDDSEAAS